MKLEEIGFYTLSDERAKTSSHSTPLTRCELILTDACNFKCTYCQGIRKDFSGTLSFEKAMNILDTWISQGLRNIRFSGGEPTLYKRLGDLVSHCKANSVSRIAVSTNGSAKFELYKDLIDKGVNDFSISLDSGCCAISDKMAGKVGSWQVVVNNIRKLSKLTYVTVGMVFTEDNVEFAVDSIMFAHSLGVADIRIISSAQYNRAIENLQSLPLSILDAHPILRYRVQNYLSNRPIRGIQTFNANKCKLVLDDMVVAGNKHFPCVIYMRQKGDPIGDVGPNMREERKEWMEEHNTLMDPICRENCLDVCVDFNDKTTEN